MTKPFVCRLPILLSELVYTVCYSNKLWITAQRTVRSLRTQWGDQKYSKGLKGQIGAQGCIKELNDTEKLIAQREEITDTTRKELV